MITNKDLQEAIAECQGERNPNAQTCIKLAAYYIIRDHIADNGATSPHYSYDAGPSPSFADYIDYDGNSDFAQAIKGKSAMAIWPIMDELMTTLEALNPRLYAGVMRRIDS